MRLFVLRHGKSDWGADYQRDHERPLANRGQRAAAAMGEFLADQGIAPEVLVTSSAVRARTTLELLASAANWAAMPVIDERLYGAGAGDVLTVAEEHRGDAESILVCGHEPWCSGVVARLTGQHPPRFPTATVASLSVDTLKANGATLDWLQRPRDL